MSHFKGMSYEEIRPIFERVWDQNQSFVPMDSEKEKGSEKKRSMKKTLARKRVGEKQSDQSAKRQKTKYEKEKDELKAYLDMDVMDLHRLVEESFTTSRPEGYDLILWGDLKILFQPDEEDEVCSH
ncbi:hypothetical protein Tco_1581700 [Tanacetum coccineum]